MFDRIPYRTGLGGLVMLAQLPLLAAPIDRTAMVQRHNPEHHALNDGTWKIRAEGLRKLP